MENKEYESYIESVVSDWGDPASALIFCASGIIEEVDEFYDEIENINPPEKVVSEAGDVLFYIYAIRQILQTQPFKFAVDHITLKTRCEKSAIRVLKAISKHACFSGELDVDGLAMELQKIIDVIVTQTSLYCSRFDISVGVAQIMESNFLKLSARYPDGRRVKNVTSENKIIKDTINGKNKP